VRTIAALAGESWLYRMNAAALALSSENKEVNFEPKTALLAAMKEVFDEKKKFKLPTEIILSGLKSKRLQKPYNFLNETSLAIALKGFNVHPEKYRDGAKTFRGYVLDHGLKDALKGTYPHRVEHMEHMEHST
jgi:hypothetical protein